MSLILVKNHENAIHITLNRPDALNALNYDMVLEITKILKQVEADDTIQSIVFSGAGDRAFCAGGDVKSVYYAGLDDPKIAWKYFYDEYQMNKIIHAYSKPILSLCHGFVMGGGYGVAGNGSHIIADDSVKFSMPETAIGFFPDVGIGWKLARAGALGMYIALTADIFDADMMMASGMATHKVSDVKSLPHDGTTLLNDIAKHSIPAKNVQNLDKINAVFALDSLEDIFAALENDSSDFAQRNLEILQCRSPISMHVTFKHLKMAADESFNQSIERDYHLACAFFSQPDIYEGIRAAVIDKDKRPKWSSSSILNISMSDIDYYFNFRDDSIH